MSCRTSSLHLVQSGPCIFIIDIDNFWQLNFTHRVASSLGNLEDDVSCVREEPRGLMLLGVARSVN
ncbi:hypothetical protein H0H93_007295, partial [Arthromyces matolae]